MCNLIYERNTQESHKKIPFFSYETDKDQRFIHTLLASGKRKAYIAGGSVNLYSVCGGQFNNTYQRCEDTYSWCGGF